MTRPAFPTSDQWLFYTRVCQEVTSQEGKVTEQQLAPILGIHQSQVNRQLKDIEKALQFFHGEQEHLILRGKGRDRWIITHTGKEIYDFGLTFIDGLARLRTRPRKDTLTVAASEGVVTYLFPYVLPSLIPNWNENGIQFQVRPFEPERIESQIRTGDVDLGIAWDGYEKEYKTESLGCIPLEHSDAAVSIIWNAVNPLSSEAASHSADSPIAPHALRKEVIVYPALDQLKRIATSMGAQKCVQVGGIPAVVNAVRFNCGVGLVPGWRWLLSQMHREYHLQSAMLAAPEGEHNMRLLAFFRAGNEAFLSEAASKFLSVARMALRSLGAPPLWKTEDPPSHLVAPLEEYRHIYYITSGKREGPAKPCWRRGTMKLDSAVDSAEAKVGKQKRKPHQDELIIGDLKIYQHNDNKEWTSEGTAPALQLDITGTRNSRFLILQGKEIAGGKGRHSVAFFSRGAHHKHDNRKCLVGTISFDAGGCPTAAPMLLTGHEFSQQDCCDIVRENLVSFLSNVESIPLA